MQYRYVSEAFLLLFLATQAYEDIKSKRINSVITAAGAAIGIMSGLYTGFPDIYGMVIGTAIGLAMLAIGYASSESIGYGDGLLMAAAGIYLGAEDTLRLLIWSLFAGSICSLVMLLTKTAGRKERLAFAPFILLGYIFMKGI